MAKNEYSADNIQILKGLEAVPPCISETRAHVGCTTLSGNS